MAIRCFGRGRDFIGTFDIETGGVRLIEGPANEIGKLHDTTVPELVALNPNLDAAALTEEIELVREGCKRFDLQAFREGHLTPVFFGSAIRNFGVRDLLISSLSVRGWRAEKRKSCGCVRRRMRGASRRASRGNLSAPGRALAVSAPLTRLCFLFYLSSRDDGGVWYGSYGRQPTPGRAS